MILNVFTNRENDDLPSVEDDIQNLWAFLIATMVADFLFNTHRYVYAIDLYEEVISLLRLLTSNTELPFYHNHENEFDSYASILSDELTATKESIQSERGQGKEASNELQRRPSSSIFQDNGSEKRERNERELAFCKRLGSTFYSLGWYLTAIWYFEKAAKISKATGNNLEEQRIYISLVIVYNASCKFDKVFSSLKKAIELCQDSQDLEEDLECYNALGCLCNSYGQFNQAISYYSMKCLGCGNKMQEAMALNNLGNLHLTNGKYDAAKAHYNESLQIRQEIGDTIGISITYNNLSCLCYSLGQYEIAIKYQKKALETTKATGTRKRLAVIYNNLGVLHQALGEHQLSLDCHKEGLKIRKEIGDIPGECRCCREISSVYDGLGQLRSLLPYHEKTTKIERVILNKPRSCQWISHYEKGLEVIDEIGVTDNGRFTLCKMGLSHLSRVQFYSVSDQLGRKIKKHETSRAPLSNDLKFLMDEQSLLLYKILASRQTCCENFTDALLTLETGRARVLVELLAKKDGTNVSLPKIDDLSNIISFLAKQRENLLFMSFLQQSICLWFIDRHGVLTFKSHVVSEELNLHDSLINFLRTGYLERTLSSNESEAKKANYQASSRMNDIDDLSELLSCQSEDDERNFLQQVIFGVVKELADDEEVILVPEGFMFRCPFAVLRNTNNDYLVDKVRMRVISSITTLMIIQDLPTEYHSNVGALLVGDPFVPLIESKGGVYKLQPLPYALKEVEMIGNLLGEQESCLTGMKATKREVLRRLPEVSLLHFAAHGRQEDGAIAFATDDQDICTEERCFLSVNDIAEVTVRAKLVVLSICHGALGRIWNAEGVVGMVRAFLVSGARSVLAPLWAIEDEATNAFMGSFYKHLIGHNMSASRALHQTMKDMRNSDEFNEERQWAPFILYGDDVTLDWNKTTNNYRATGKTVNT